MFKNTGYQKFLNVKLVNISKRGFDYALLLELENSEKKEVKFSSPIFPEKLQMVIDQGDTAFLTYGMIDIDIQKVNHLISISTSSPTFKTTDFVLSEESTKLLERHFS